MAEEEAHIYALRTTANREDQVMDFITSNAKKKKLAVYSIIRPHGMRGYIFLEAATRQDAEQSALNVPYARGLLPSEVDYREIEHMLEQVKREINIQKSDIVEIISGPFKREKAKITRIDKAKEEVVVELLEAAVPIPITVKMDAVKVIRRETEEGEEAEVEEGEKPEEKLDIIQGREKIKEADIVSAEEQPEEEEEKYKEKTEAGIKEKRKRKKRKKELEEEPFEEEAEEREEEKEETEGKGEKEELEEEMDEEAEEKKEPREKRKSYAPPIPKGAEIPKEEE